MYNWKVVLLTIVVLLTVRVLDPKLVEQFRLNYFDSLQSYQKPIKSDNIVIVDIDEKALNYYLFFLLCCSLQIFMLLARFS